MAKRNEQIGNHLIDTTYHLMSNEDKHKKAQLVSEFWLAFVSFFDEYCAGEVTLSAGKKVTIKRIRET